MRQPLLVYLAQLLRFVRGVRWQGAGRPVEVSPVGGRLVVFNSAALLHEVRLGPTLNLIFFTRQGS